jgi:hypothetical protein
MAVEVPAPASATAMGCSAAVAQPAVATAAHRQAVVLFQDKRSPWGKRQ